MSIGDAGVLSDGRAVQAVRLGAEGGLQVEVLAWGATLRSLRAPTPRGPVEVLLQLARIGDYETDTRFINPVIGRCANRIGGAAFAIEGRAFEVTANEGPNCLHGGSPGWHKRLWRVQAADERRCVLAYTSPDGESGFPGQVEAEVEFAVADLQTLEIRWRARTDAPTPVNLTHHLYFNLAGTPDHTVLQDELAVGGSAITPVRADLIPTGEVRPVEGSAFDLRAPRRLDEVLRQPDEQLRQAGGLDLNWALDAAQAAATLACPDSGLKLEIETDQPGLQVYSGQGLGGPFRPHQALVLEPQGFPDAINRPAFPSVLLRPGETYDRRARYRFSS